jgi:hypothetical protein
MGGAAGAGGSTGTGGAGGATTPEDDWTVLQNLLSTIRGVATAPITDIESNIKYTNGMLLGNGDVGVVVGGETTSLQKFHFGKSDFWGVGGTQNAMGATGPSVLSLGKLTISSKTASTDPNAVYRMEQDILNAEVRSTLRLGDTIVSARSWTADGDNVFVTELSSAAGSPPVAITVDLAMPNDATYPFASGVTNGAVWVTRANNQPGYVARVAIAVGLAGTPFAATTPGSFSSSGELTLNGGQTVNVVAVVRSDTRGDTTGPSNTALRDQAVAKLAALTAQDVGKFRDDHRTWWKDYWLKSFVRLNDSALESYYYGALYVLGSATRAGKLAPSLWGNFVPNDLMRWGGRYFLNYNEQAAFYGVFSSNRPELALPYSDVISYQLPWQRNLTHAAGYQGATYQRTLNPFNQYKPQPSTTPVAATKSTSSPADQKSNGTFAALPLIWYWEYTQDADYLKTKLYPLLKDLDAYFRDYATFDGTRYAIEHSAAHEGGDDLNPNLDVGFMKRVERTCIDASIALGVDANLRPTWQDTIAKLSKYPTGTFGGKTVYLMAENIGGVTTIDATFHPGDQPINMEGGVFPGENIYLGGDASELRIALDSLEQMHSWGVTPGGNSNNGFVKEFIIAARVGWPGADLIDKLKAAIAYSDASAFGWRATNLTHAQGGGGIETVGNVEAIDSMLMQSEGGVVRVFPVWPADRDASFKRLRAKGAFVVSSEQKGGRVLSIRVLSEKGLPLSIKNPWAPRMLQATEIDSAGNTVAPVSCTLAADVASCPTSPGKTYALAASP